MFDIAIEGRFACFTKPYTGSSPVSYECITPPAVAGILSATYWHPGLLWVTREIQVLAPIVYENILYNQPNFRAPTKQQAGSRQAKLTRHQVLRSPAYRVKVELVAIDPAIDIKKAVGIATKHLERGRQYFQPYMGLSDFFATVRFTDRAQPPKAQPINKALGQFPQYALYEPVAKRSGNGFMAKPNVANRPNLTAVPCKRSTVYFDADINAGVIAVPDYDLNIFREQAAMGLDICKQAA